MADATFTAVTEMLKHQLHDDTVHYYFNHESVLFENFRTRTQEIQGRDHLLAVQTTQNPAATGATEGGALATPVAPATTEASFDNQEYNSVYGISWKLMKKAEGGSAVALEKVLTFMERSTLTPFLRLLNAGLLSDGRGKMAELSAADNNANITNLKNIPNLEIGAIVDVMDTDNTTKHGDSLTVTGIDLADPSSPNITLSGAPSSTASGDYIVIQDTCDGGAGASLHSHGILGIVDNDDPPAVRGDYGGIDRGTAGNEWWESAVLSNSGTDRSLTEDLLLQASDAARLKGHGSSLDKWFTNQAICRRYHELIRAESWITMSAAEGLSGGLGREGQGEAAKEDGRTVYHIGGVPVYVDPYFAAKTIVGVNSKEWWIGIGDAGMEVPKTTDEIFPGTQMFRQTTNMTWDVAWYYQMQFLCENPAGQVKIEDLAHS